MKTTNIAKFATPGSFLTVPSAIRLTYLLVFFTLTIIGSSGGQAQTNDSDNDVSVQAVVFVVIAGTMCLIFCACYACICFSRHKCSISDTPQLSPVHYSRRNVRQTNSYFQNSAHDCDQCHSVPPRQIYQTGGILTGHSEYTSAARTVSGSHSPIKSEAVSLPEATLYQGDAPPTYEEAIRMKTL